MTATDPNDMVPDRAGKAPHLFFIACAAGCVAFGVWASKSTLDIVSTAQGEVVPSTRIKSIQHLEGGIVREISVKEGQRVDKGQVLVVLEPTSSSADVGELEVRINALRVEITRLEAEAVQKDKLVFDDDLVSNHSEIVRQAQERFETRSRAHKSRIAKQNQTIIQREYNIKEIRARTANAQRMLKLQNEQVAISEELLKDNLANRYTHIDLLKTAAELKGRIIEDSAIVMTAEAALKEAQSELEMIGNEFKQEVGKELDEARTKFKELTQRMFKYKDSLKRTILRSPVEGVIKTVYIGTAGGVIKPGETIVDIVPGEDRLIIEARLPTQDIGYVQVGQSANVQLASADAMRFDSLNGTVVHVSPDTMVTNEGQPFYKVRVSTESDHFRRGNRQYSLYPGMQVVTNIQTGERTVLEYILDPLRDSIDEAMKER